VMPVITVEDKLMVFSESIIKKVEKDSEQKLHEFSLKYNKLLNEERQRILAEAEVILEQMKKKAEAEKKQIILKASMEKEHVFLIKKKDIFDIVVKDIKKIAALYTKKSEYENFLKICINDAISYIKSEEVIIILKTEDAERYSEDILSFIAKMWSGKIKASIDITDEDILGGCIAENLEHSIRADCSLEALIRGSSELIGKLLMENL